LSDRQRLDKRLSALSGLSRADAGRYVRAGRVQIDGEVARDAGASVLADARLTVDGIELVPPAEPPRLALFHKPLGVLATVGRRPRPHLARQPWPASSWTWACTRWAASTPTPTVSCCSARTAR
jgi:16S rRNA U516 pseudouridylate synthase RsuA-like enzyme